MLSGSDRFMVRMKLDLYLPTRMDAVYGRAVHLSILPREPPRPRGEPGEKGSSGKPWVRQG